MAGAGGDPIELVNLSLDFSRPSSQQASREGERSSLLEIHIYLPDLTFLALMIDQHTQATEIMDMIIATLGLNPTEARHVLSLWLVSADLQLQLKPNHCPTQLFGKWPVYLRKYTSVSPKTAAIQKPLVHLKRNVYISREEDLKVKDNEILELLFTEARCNIMDGTYPCDRDLLIKLAGLLCAVQYGPFNEEQHTIEFYKSVHSIFPLSVQSNTKLLDEYCQAVEFAHKKFDSLGKQPTGDTLNDESRLMTAYQTYLSSSHVLPYYGCVFFDGYIESTNKSFLHSSWLAVQIGTNTDGIYIISTEKEEPLLGILYEELTWEYVEMCTCSSAECHHNTSSTTGAGKLQPRMSRKSKHLKGDKIAAMPSLLLQYPASPDEQSEGVKFQVLRVYTQSARLIDAFIDNCSETMKEKCLCSPIPTPEVAVFQSATVASKDCVDTPKFPVSVPQQSADSTHTRESLERSIKSLRKPNKLLCQSFTKDGKCVSI
ncbi:putative FERM domain-containing protein FRMD8P1 isoform X1 [Watersipora subatra]|uniref:putative FERM domain-containing protein FRMD8P1 isoform X1 n=1 Tax=Watersipora subatra TaxID=2589382 RepID=UPI00355B11E7